MSRAKKYRLRDAPVHAVEVTKKNAHNVLSFIGDAALYITQTMDDGISLQGDPNVSFAPWGSFVVKLSTPAFDGARFVVLSSPQFRLLFKEA